MENVLETQELDSRRSNGLAVTLWWVKDTLETYVTVLDMNVNPPVEYCIDVPPGVNPRKVFQHPMAHYREAV